MRSTVRAITNLYLVAVVWFAVMLSTVLVALWPMGAIYSALHLAPEIRASSTMILAIVAATAAAALMRHRLHAAPPRADDAASDASQSSAEAPLTTTR